MTVKKFVMLIILIKLNKINAVVLNLRTILYSTTQTILGIFIFILMYICVCVCVCVCAHARAFCLNKKNHFEMLIFIFAKPDKC